LGHVKFQGTPEIPVTVNTGFQIGRSTAIGPVYGQIRTDQAHWALAERRQVTLLKLLFDHRGIEQLVGCSPRQECQ
jgi:hypothetical protein